MLRFPLLVAAVVVGLLLMPSHGAATARVCLPITSEVVSLGEGNARAYTQLSLERKIASGRTSLETSGRGSATVVDKRLECAPFPNILGADEWRCTGRARVCAAN